MAGEWTSDSWVERREIQRVVHFHTDHFEPGRKDGSGQVMGLDHVRKWLKDCDKLPWARRASTFYKSMWLAKITPESALKRQQKGMLVKEVEGQNFGIHSFGQDDDIVRLLAKERDFHIHIHHEHWCSGPVTGTPVNPLADAVKLDAMAGWLCDRYRELGVPTDGWGFVHGAWALNGSDRNICQIPNEIEILHQHGCKADFTFPAGRPWCDPTLVEPFTIIPFTNYRCYDRNAAKPMRLEPGVDAMTPDRFLIWNHRIDANFSSLDNLRNRSVEMNEADNRTLANRAVLTWLEKGWVHPGNHTLYLKTHAHSLWHEHWDSLGNHTSSLTSPVAKIAFPMLETHCRAHGAEVEYLSVREVLAELQELDRRA